MFRKRERTILEDSLLAEGVDIYSPIGRNLLSRMIEHGYSQDRIAIEPLHSHSPLTTMESFLIIPVADPGPLRVESSLAQISPWTDPYHWRVYVWRSILGHANGGEWKSETVYSKYGMYGKLIRNV